MRRRGVETVILAGADPHGIMRGQRRETPRSVVGKRPAQLVAVDERPSVYGVDHCVAMRRDEIAAQAAVVTDWETERYLEAL